MLEYGRKYCEVRKALSTPRRMIASSKGEGRRSFGSTHNGCEWDGDTLGEEMSASHGQSTRSEADFSSANEATLKAALIFACTASGMRLSGGVTHPEHKHPGRQHRTHDLYDAGQHDHVKTPERMADENGPACRAQKIGDDNRCDQHGRESAVSRINFCLGAAFKASHLGVG